MTNSENGRATSPTPPKLNIILRILKHIVPESIRRSELVSRFRQALVKILHGHDAIYNNYYYAALEKVSAGSHEPIAESILIDLRPNSVVDVGCGTGLLLEALRHKGCQGIGLELSKVARDYCRARGLDVQEFDLESDHFQDDRTFDVAISMEVAEHLPETCASRFVDLLTRLSNVVVFTAAPPGQAGSEREASDHVNEQPPSYWISKFQHLGFAHDEELSRRWREVWREKRVVDPVYCQNLMIFRRIL